MLVASKNASCTQLNKKHKNHEDGKNIIQHIKCFKITTTRKEVEHKSLKKVNTQHNTHLH